MKAVPKITIFSCIFCYFAGLWMIASRFGLVKLVSKYGLTAAFTQIPKDFPQMKYLYMGMAAYTVLFVLLSILIVRFTNKASK